MSPLPRDEATPPVTKTCLVVCAAAKGTPVGSVCGEKLARPRGSRLATSPDRHPRRSEFSPVPPGSGAVRSRAGPVVTRACRAPARAARAPSTTAPATWSPTSTVETRPGGPGVRAQPTDQPVVGARGRPARPARRRRLSWSSAARSVATMLPAPVRSSVVPYGVSRDRQRRGCRAVDVAGDRDQVGGGEAGQNARHRHRRPRHRALCG